MKSVGMLVILIVVSFGYTQAPDTLWTRAYGGTEFDAGNSIQQTSDGGYIVTGGTNSFGHNLWLLKLDSSGDTLWTKTYGGINNDGGKVVLQTSDGGYFIAGNTESFGVGNGDIWLLKTDSLGDTIWTQTHGFVGSESCEAAEQTSDGGYVITGWTGWDLLLLKTDQYGDIVWAKSYAVEEPFYWARGWDVHETYDGGYIIAGSIIAEAAWYHVGWLLKTDSGGDTVWTKEYDGPFHSVAQTADSGYIACGGTGYLDLILYLVRTDAQGDSIWTRQYSSETQCGWSMEITDDNGYIITGTRGDWSSEDDVLLFKTDESGDSLWCAVYGGYDCDRGHEVHQTSDGGYIVVGRTASFGAGSGDFWILKTESDVGVEEQPIAKPVEKRVNLPATILRGPLQLPEGKECKVFDITGRVVQPDKIQLGIYFIEIDGVVTQKVVKVR